MFGYLLRFQLREQLGLSAFAYNWRNDRKQAAKGLGMGVLLVFSFGMIIAMLGIYSYAVFAQSAEPGLASGMLAALLSAGQLLAVFTLMRSLPGYLSSSRDLFFLRSLPLRDSDVLGAKLFQSLLFPMLMQLLIQGPGVVMYAIFWNGGPLFVIKALLVMLMAPLVPAAIVGAGSLLLLSVSTGARRSEHLMTVLWFALVIVIMIGNQWLSRSMGTMLATEEGMQQTLASLEGGLNMISRAYPVARWGARAMVDSGTEGWLSLLAYVAVSAGAYAILWMAGGRMYARSAMAGGEAASSRKTGKRRAEAARTPVSALITREWRLIIRSSVYSLNGLIGVIMGPLMIIMVRMSSGGDFDEILTLINGAPQVGIWVVAGLSAFIGCLNPAASTCLTREGRTLWISKMIPVSYRDQARAKIWFSVAVSFAGGLLAAASGVLLMNLSAIDSLIGLGLALLFVYPITALGVILDMFHPNLLWVSETAAVKRSVNVLLHMLLGMILIVAAGFVAAIAGPYRLYVVLGIGLVLTTVTTLVYPRIAGRLYLRIDA